MDKRDRVLDGVQFEKSFKKGVLNKFGGWIFGSSNVGLLEVSKAEKQKPRMIPGGRTASPDHVIDEVNSEIM